MRGVEEGWIVGCMSCLSFFLEIDNGACEREGREG